MSAETQVFFFLALSKKYITETGEDVLSWNKALSYPSVVNNEICLN
jgi:hypothetical protein